VAAIATAGAALAVAPSARADAQWQDGLLATSTYTQCVVNTVETGADAWAGYLMDPNNPPRPGEVFYGHAAFAALTSACYGDMAAELDLVLPPGVSLATDARHPIRCYYQEPDAADKVVDPTCPTHTVGGAYGPQLPAGDGGGGWDLPPGRTYEVQFPLVSTRWLKGPAGGHCPASADEIAFHPDRDCLITAVHVVDGDSDPWLTPSEELFLAPPGPTHAKVSLALPSGQHLRSIARARALRVTCSATVAGRCRVRATIAGRQARALRLPGAKKTKKPYTLGSASRVLHRAGSASLRIRLSRRAAAALKHARRLRITLIATGGNGATSHRTVTLKR
jgi:hypothetical protein